MMGRKGCSAIKGAALAALIALSILVVLALALGQSERTVEASLLISPNAPKVITITEPAPYEVITSTSLPSYYIRGTYDCSPLGEGGTLELGVVYLSFDGGTHFYQVYEGGWSGTWIYTWELPIVDTRPYTLWAKLMCVGQGWTTPLFGYSDPVTVTVDTKGPIAEAPIPHRYPWVTSTVIYS